MLEALKSQAVAKILGEKAMVEKDLKELDELLDKATKELIKKVGGKTKWAALSAEVQAEKCAGMIEGVIAELGKEAFEMLSDEEKCVLKLFIWAGCGCHKDLNTV